MPAREEAVTGTGRRWEVFDLINANDMQDYIKAYETIARGRHFVVKNYTCCYFYLLMIYCLLIKRNYCIGDLLIFLNKSLSD